jgi:uncharacterized protein with FMN-binding domain
MRRVILAVTGTIAGLVALLGFRSHVPSATPAAAAEGSAGPAPSASSLPPGTRAVDGSVASTVYGPVQIQLDVRGKKIAGVTILQQPHRTVNDLQIGQFAFPKLIGETLAAQSAHIDAISGASYTSAGYIQSLQSAIDSGA